MWVAYHPSSPRLSPDLGAEALARWTHPEKGPAPRPNSVPPPSSTTGSANSTDFVPRKRRRDGTDQPRDGNFILRLTCPPVLTDRSSRCSGWRCCAARVDPRTLRSSDRDRRAGRPAEAVDICFAARNGVNISIYDYGTRLSTLDISRRCRPARSRPTRAFQRGYVRQPQRPVDVPVDHRPRARAWAHGRVRRASNRPTSRSTGANEVRMSPRYIIGRPMSLESLIKRITVDRKRSVA